MNNIFVLPYEERKRQAVQISTLIECCSPLEKKRNISIKSPISDINEANHMKTPFEMKIHGVSPMSNKHKQQVRKSFRIATTNNLMEFTKNMFAMSSHHQMNESSVHEESEQEQELNSRNKEIKGLLNSIIKMKKQKGYCLDEIETSINNMHIKEDDNCKRKTLRKTVMPMRINKAKHKCVSQRRCSVVLRGNNTNKSINVIKNNNKLFKRTVIDKSISKNVLDGNSNNKDVSCYIENELNETKTSLSKRYSVIHNSPIHFMNNLINSNNSNTISNSFHVEPKTKRSKKSKNSNYSSFNKLDNNTSKNSLYHHISFDDSNDNSKHILHHSTNSITIHHHHNNNNNNNNNNETEHPITKPNKSKFNHHPLISASNSNNALANSAPENPERLFKDLVYRKLIPTNYKVYDSLSDEEDFTPNPPLLMPKSLFMTTWNIILNIIQIYLVYIMMPLITFSSKTPLYEIIIETIIDIVFIVNCVIYFFIPYHNETLSAFEYESALHNICIHYMKTTFVFNVLMAIPFNTVINYYYCTETHQHTFCVYFKLTKLFYTLKRLLMQSSHTKRVIVLLPSCITEFIHKCISSKAEHLCMFILFMLSFIHIMSCVWVDIGKHTHPSWISRNELNDSKSFDVYVCSFYYNIATIFSVGYGDVTASNTYERVYNIVIQSVGMFLYSYIMSSMTCILKDSREEGIELAHRMMLLEDLSGKYALKKTLVTKIKKCLLYEQEKGFDRQVVFLQTLPLNVVNEMLLRMFGEVLKFHFFKHTNYKFKHKVMFNLKPAYAEQGTLLVSTGAVVEDLIIVRKGVMVLEYRYKGKGIRICRFRRGDHYGELDMLLNKISGFDLVIKSKYAEVFLLSKEKLLEIGGEFPDILAKMKRRALVNKALFDGRVKMAIRKIEGNKWESDVNRNSCNYNNNNNNNNNNKVNEMKGDESVGDDDIHHSKYSNNKNKKNYHYYCYYHSMVGNNVKGVIKEEDEDVEMEDVVVNECCVDNNNNNNKTLVHITDHSDKKNKQLNNTQHISLTPPLQAKSQIHKQTMPQLISHTEMKSNTQNRHTLRTLSSCNALTSINPKRNMKLHPHQLTINTHVNKELSPLLLGNKYQKKNTLNNTSSFSNTVNKGTNQVLVGYGKSEYFRKKSIKINENIIENEMIINKPAKFYENVFDKWTINSQIKRVSDIYKILLHNSNSNSNKQKSKQKEDNI